MPQIQNSVLPEYPNSERAFPWLNSDGRIAPVKAPQPVAPTQVEQPIYVQGPDGSLVEFPAGTPRETMTEALRRHYGGPSMSFGLQY